jgi:hypothetical protein
VKDYHRMAEADVFEPERKAPSYLGAGIPEVWVVDLSRGAVHIATPAGTRTVSRGDTAAPMAFPDVVDVTALLG